MEGGSGAGEHEGGIDLPTFFPYRLSVVEIAVSRAIALLYSDRLGLSQAEWRAFAALGDLQPASGVEIARYTGLDKMKVTRAVSHLTEKGLVTRVADPGDKRRMVLRLTGNGKRILHDMIPKARARETFMLSVLSASERETLNDLLGRIEARAVALQEQG